MSIGILGGGLAGLAIAAHLDRPCEVLEKDARTGGHCRSVQEHGFTYDAGGPHILFSADADLLAYMVSLLAGNVRQGRRNNKVYYDGRYVKYPFENGLHDLAAQDRFECLRDYLYNSHPEPANFREWLYYAFGTAIAEKYLIPYNEKIWKARCEELDLSWVAGRIPRPTTEEIIKSAVGVETEGYTHQLHYYYPESGGIESLPRALQRKVGSVTTGFAVQHVRRSGDGWCVSDGRRERCYDALIATIPVQDLAAALEGLPPEIGAAARRLRYNSLITVTLGLADDRLPRYTAVYFPGPEFRFHRVSFPAVFSPANAPAGQSLVQAEITANRGDGAWEMSDEDLVADVSRSLEAIELIRSRTICYARVIRSKYGYVVRDGSYSKDVGLIKDYFGSIGISLCGRVAEFEYINMDVCIARGRKLAAELDAAMGPVAVPASGRERREV